MKAAILEGYGVLYCVLKDNTYGKSTGRNGNYSTNYQNTGRELSDTDYVLLFEEYVEKEILQEALH